MKKKYALRTLLASMVVTLALTGPAVVLSSTTTPTEAEIIFSGAELRYCPSDGSVQAIFHVSVDRVLNSDGASFYLKYNSDYMEPSYMEDTPDPANATVIHKANSVISDSLKMHTDDFFASDPDLYYIEDAVTKERTTVSPFDTTSPEYAYVDPNQSVVAMALWLDQDVVNKYNPATGKVESKESVITQNGGARGRVQLLENINETDEEKVYVLNRQQWYKRGNREYQEPAPTDRYVTLGALSFRVKEDRLDEILDYFDGKSWTCRHDDVMDRPLVSLVGLDGQSLDADGDGQQDTTFLLDLPETIPNNADPWQIGYYAGRYKEMPKYYHRDESKGPVADKYIFDFEDKTIVSVEATNPEITINAYQNYTDGDPGDLILSMGRYCPTVTVTYADGSKENVPFPWGQAKTDGIDTGYAAYDLNASTAVTTGNYDPTHGWYEFSQLYTYIGADGKAHAFPTPVKARLTVTPIHVLDVTADDLEKSYKVTDVTAQVTTVNALNLPAQARIITDVVPAGVSLVTDIHGWTPVQPYSWVAGTSKPSTWPTNDLNTLKATTYTAAAGAPFWPDPGKPADVAGTADPAQQSKYIGDYLFETSKDDHATAQPILGSDIKAAFHWLTVPKRDDDPTKYVDYELDMAKRRIVDPADYVSADDYVVKYVSTVTENMGPDAGGQPTLTLSVAKANLASVADKSMKPGSIFRVWLPNGLELGTGQNDGGIPAIDNWFADPDNASVPNPHVYGYYKTNNTVTDTALGTTYSHLITNPYDPAKPASTANKYYNQERETLRRYINLGGWYKVAICEDPGTGDHWTEPIPVYVPPRRNEYTESKIYNFIAENAALYNWPGGVGDTLHLPRGSYTPVGPQDGTTAALGVGLPLYDVNGSVQDGQSNFSAVFDGDYHRPNYPRYRESYGVGTIYDGQTGAQPGEVFTVQVEQTDTTHTAPWKPPTAGETLHDRVDPAHPANTSVYKYGPTPLIDGRQFMAYGYVYQPDSSDPTTYKATLRRDKAPADEPPAQTERIKLLSWDDEGISPVGRDKDHDNVTVVTYDTVTEGYTVRQSFTLTIRNVGTTDIYGLDIDGVVDGYNLNDNGLGTNRQGGHFEMLQPPASFLPVGADTTFTLTYVYDLRSNVAPNALKYRDTLYITSNGHDNIEPNKYDAAKQYDTGAASDDYLLDFDAEITVSKDPLHRVDVIYRPTNGNMGTANLMVGEQGSAASAILNYTPTTRTYPKNDLVYVTVNKKDEYAVKAITAVIDGVTVDLLTSNRYRPTLSFTGALDPFYGTATEAENTEVYVFKMPDHDVTVTVDFYEPFLSKLRLEDLIDFSSPKNTDADPTVNDLKTSSTSPHPIADHTYPVWRKTFTGTKPDASGNGGSGELKAAYDWSQGTSEDADLYLMTQGTARPHNSDPKLEGQQFLPSENQYLVVIDAEDDLSQVEATIRKVVYHEDYQGTDPTYPNGKNYEIELDISMEFYPYNVEKKTGNSYNWGRPGYTGTPIYTPGPAGGVASLGYGPSPAFTGTPAGPTSVPPADGSSTSSVHTSVQFDSPKPGESSYVRVTLSGRNPETNNTEYRYYYLEIHRRTDKPDVELHYGNSPYGMIMNDPKFTIMDSANPSQVDAAKTKAAQDKAKAAFRGDVDNDGAVEVKGYTFAGAASDVRPDVVLPDAAKGRTRDLTLVTYWREAWARNQSLFEPESYTGINDIAVPHQYDTDVYDPQRDNLDLNDYAYFAILGQPLREPGVIRATDSSGRTVDLKKITAVALDVDWATDAGDPKKGVTLLDTTQTKQVDRFKGDTTTFPILDLGVQGRKLETKSAAPATVTNDYWPVQAATTTTSPSGGGDPVTTTTWSFVENIRPGRYAIVYSYLDFDGTTVLQAERPFVILREVGDVNADGVRDSVKAPATAGGAADSDEYHIEDRVGTDPLGYEAGKAPDTTHPNGVDYPFANIFKYRVADVNNDRNINNIDANQVQKNVKLNGGWLQFYDPVDYGLPTS